MLIVGRGSHALHSSLCPSSALALAEANHFEPAYFQAKTNLGMAVRASACHGLHRTSPFTEAVRSTSTPFSRQRPCRVEQSSNIFAPAHRPSCDPGPASLELSCPCRRALPTTVAHVAETRCSRSSYHCRLNPLFSRPSAKYGPAISSREAIAEQLATSVLRGGKFAAQAVLEGVVPLISSGVKTVFQKAPTEQAKRVAPPAVERPTVAPAAPSSTDAFEEDVHGNGQEDLFWDGEWNVGEESADDEDADLYYGLRMATRASLAVPGQPAPNTPVAAGNAEGTNAERPRSEDSSLTAFTKDPSTAWGLLVCAVATVMFNQPFLFLIPLLGANISLVMRAYSFAEVAGALAAVVGGGVATLVVPDKSFAFVPILVAVTFLVLRASAQSATGYQDGSFV